MFDHYSLTHETISYWTTLISKKGSSVSKYNEKKVTKNRIGFREDTKRKRCPVLYRVLMDPDFQRTLLF